MRCEHCSAAKQRDVRWLLLGGLSRDSRPGTFLKAGSRAFFELT